MSIQPNDAGQLIRQLFNTWQGHMALQAAALAIQFSGQVETLTEGHKRLTVGVHLIISLAQFTLAAWNHFKNPDGTSAKTAWRPESK